MKSLPLLLLLLFLNRAWSNPSSTQDAANVGAEVPLENVSWRDRYELGPGDVINFALFGRPELDRNGFRVSPDGSISYLQAQNILVTGLTINETRLKIEEGLMGYFKSPRVIITPVEVGSKRFSILGKVVKKGVYTLSTPTTLVEAVAQAGGIETGLFERKTVEIADMDRSFITRKGYHLPVDFRKLFNEGDLSQNIALEPNDFIYIASSVSNDYFVLGAVVTPGVQGYTADASLVSALTRRGGLTDRAFTDKVLVVRGSFSNPETHVISLKDILAAKARDFKLLPDDIVYVSERPWIVAEDILKLAASAFATSMASTWINNNTTRTSD